MRRQLRSRCSTARNASRHLRNAHGAPRCASRPRRGAHPPTCCVHGRSRRRAPSRQHSPSHLEVWVGRTHARPVTKLTFCSQGASLGVCSSPPALTDTGGGRKPRVPNRNQLLALTGHILVRSKHAASGSCRTTQRTRLSPEKGLPNSAALKGTMVPTSGAVLGFNTAPFTHMLKKIFK